MRACPQGKWREVGQALKIARDVTAVLMAPRSTLSQVHLWGLISQASLAMSVKTH